MDLNCEKTVGQTKSLLRAAMRRARSALDENIRTQAESALCRNILEVLNEHSFNVRCVAAYLAKSPEASIDETIRVLISRGVRVCVPCESDNGPQFAILSSIDDVEINARGVREPKGKSIVDLMEVDVVPIPGLAFSTEGARLGQGGGWYDCALQAMPNALKIGVCFDVQIVENLPQETHDVRMDFVITESRIARVKL